MGFAELLFGRRRYDGGSPDRVKPAARCSVASRGGSFSGKEGPASCEADPLLILATSAFSRLRGLMGRNGFKGSCLIAPCCDIHTFGMGAAIDAAFIDAEGRVLAVRRSLPPGRRVRVRGAAGVLERFAREGPWLNEGDMLALSALRLGDASGLESAKEKGRGL